MNIALITGCTSGLGFAYVDAVIQLYPEIHEIWLIARREHRLKEIAQNFPKKHFVLIPLDLSDIKAYRNLEEKLQKEKPQIQIFIHAAALSKANPFEKIALEDALSMIELNCKGTTALTKICLPYMIDHSLLLEVSSTSAFVPNKNGIVYSATKAYLSSFCLGLKEELKDRSIHVCTVCPGFMLTEMTKGNLTKKQQRLPVIDPKQAAIKSLKAAQKGKSVYTTGIFYKFYHLLTKLLPQNIMVKLAAFD